METIRDHFPLTKGFDTNKKCSKFLSFRLFGSFAHFDQPISNRLRNTYSVVPKPQLLGLLGSIAGLAGYKNRKTLPRFYSMIGNLKICIKPNKSNDIKFMVNYNSMNSFLNNRVDSPSPNVIINEQVLMEPDYEIGLLLNENNELHHRLIENIRNNRSVFPIYLGKNEFFANIQFISLETYERNSLKEIACESILPFDEIEKEGLRSMKLEMLPIGFNEKFKYTYCLMAIPQKKCTLTVKNPEKFIVAKDNVYYAF